jgi:RNA polymerase sigma factor (sigma-70 family)
MTRDLDDLSDAELIERAREGESRAYGVLWKRHWHAGRAMAASVTGRFEPDDLASEAFARILKSIEKGSGPRSGFRSYLATTVRNVAIDWSRRKSTPNIEDADVIEDWTYSELTALERMDRKTVADAFYALPDNWQEVLWYTVVEEMQPRDVAPLLGLTPNAVSALSARAREGLRQAWINAHLCDGDASDPVHEWTIGKLGSYVRGRLSKADHRRVVGHLSQCESCANAAAEADHVGSRLALGILPIFLGVSGAAAYSAWATGQGEAAVAAALPSAGLELPGGRLLQLLQSATSSTSIGVTTVAASVITAVALTATAASTGGPSAPPAYAESSPAAHGDRGTGRATEPGSEPPIDVAEEPEVDAYAPIVIEHQPAEAREEVGEPAASPDPAEVPPPTWPAESGAPASPVQPPTPEPPLTPPGDGDPTDPPVQPETPAPVGCEAAVRSVPAADTLFAYGLDDPDDASTSVDLVHGVTGSYERDATGWSLSDGVLRPASDVFTVQVWFRAESGGGRLLGFTAQPSGASWAYDRHLFLTDDGRVVFGVWPDVVQTVSSSDSYVDGRWHQATATLSADGMALYVDGELVAADSTVTRAHAFDGYWRVGAGPLGNWGPETPTARTFSGSLAYAAVYSTALTAEQVRAQWDLCR